MSFVIFGAMFLAVFCVMLWRGAGMAFAYVFLPLTLVFNYIPQVPMPGVPNLSTTTALGLGALAAIVLKPAELWKVRWNVLDILVILLPSSIFITTALTYNAWDGYRDTFEFSLRWTFPYLLGRIALQDPAGRKAALRVLCVITPILGFCAAIECVIRPNMVNLFLRPLKLDSTNSMILTRFGMARALVTAGQPIDLGCTGVLAGTFVLILIPATGTKWRSPLALAGILGSGAMMFGSISGSAWVGFGVALGCYVLLSRPNYGKLLPVPLLLVAILGMVGLSWSMLNEQISQDRPEDEIAASKWIRVRIIQDAWEQASTAGVFGYGKQLDTTNIGIGSVDNSYLLFIMTTGWYSMTLWLAVMFAAAALGARALRRATTASERFPVAAALGGFLGTLVAMYTVYFGFTYAILFASLLGMISTMDQMLAARRTPALSMAGGYLPHGIPVAAR